MIGGRLLCIVAEARSCPRLQSVLFACSRVCQTRLRLRAVHSDQKDNDIGVVGGFSLNARLCATAKVVFSRFRFATTATPRFPMKISFLLTISSLTLPVVASANSTDYRAQAAALVAQMTLEEKAALCSGLSLWSTKPIERLGIPSIVLCDGPHGVRRAAPDAQPGEVTNSLPATCFPTAPALAATWNTELIQEVGAALGAEA